jgi:spore coat polysaccharide biosynthesis protein SpsF
MNATLLLQARTNSTRLPGKVLLPIGGMPLVVLAARRASNSGQHVIVVTSEELSDDVLCEALERWGVDYFRGELENTLKRFVDATDSLADSHVVVRLTGDNVFPDGAFINELLKDFEDRQLPYLSCGGKYSGLPYGVSAEVTRVKYLREAHNRTESRFDREHVTPWVIAKYGSNFVERYRTIGMEQWRCTIDTMDDYLLISRLFVGCENPEGVSLEALLQRLKEASTNVVTPIPASRMVLGAAQFGLQYGVANTTGRPEQFLVNSIIHTAISNGVQYIDTAMAYGDSERVVGKSLLGGWASRTNVITKLSPLEDCPADAPRGIVQVFVERSFYQSCSALNSKKIAVLMLHRAQHLTAWSGGVWDAVCELKHQGLIGALGVSVQSPAEALIALEFLDVSFIQMPFNILDHRWNLVVEKIMQVRQSRPLIVHIRSSLLQGILTTEREDLWEKARCSNPTFIIDWLRNKSEKYSNGDVIELCIRFALSQKWIDGVVIGVDNLDQLIYNLKISSAGIWNEAKLGEIIEGRPYISKETLNPATWEHEND